MMSVMRCEYNSLKIIICTVTLQRLKIGKRATAVKLRDSLTGSDTVRSFVCFYVWVRERERIGRKTRIEGMREYAHLLLFTRKSSRVCRVCEVFLVHSLVTFTFLIKKKKHVHVDSTVFVMIHVLLYMNINMWVLYVNSQHVPSKIFTNGFVYTNKTLPCVLSLYMH